MFVTKYFHLFSICCLTVAQHATNNEDFSFVASLKRKSHFSNFHHFCTGSILGRRWILTAAHCFENIQGKPLDFFAVDVGSHYLSTGTRYPIANAFVHPEFVQSPQIYKNDLALVQLERPIADSPGVRAVELGTIRDWLEVPVVGVGWGRLSYNSGSVPEKRRVVNMTTIKYESCQAKHAQRQNLVDREMHICGVGTEGNTLCFGYSGAPLVDPYTGRQVAVFSTMEDCTPEYPFLFVRIELYIDWIRDITGLKLVLN
ncbi:hypothetical protein GEV33_005387 [Tenebrio molitor]|uniref:Peptidase S1 domain-containing protein n=1 Tax=Tenebrio molitor TaxID=7067 RepID=A0A8J6LCQ1_TENMO|nr:hypothetical protein GEV33_005387 [Tenebrio molitor]